MLFIQLLLFALLFLLLLLLLKFVLVFIFKAVNCSISVQICTDRRMRRERDVGGGGIEMPRRRKVDWR